DVRLRPPRPGGPVETPRGLLQDVSETAGLEVGEAKLERVAPGRGSKLVHEALAAERVRRRRQGPVGTMPERGTRLHEPAFAPAREVRSLDLLGARVDVDEVPGREPAGFVEARLDVDHGRRAEHRPGELLGPRPLEADRRTGRPGQPGRLDGA